MPRAQRLGYPLHAVTTQISRWGTALLLAASAAGTLAAQTSGAIEGYVVDAEGLAVSGAQVTLAGEALLARSLPSH